MANWEQQLHRELEDLPELQAPSTLIPRVMAHIRSETDVPLYQRSLWQWPAALRVAAMAAMVAVVAALACGIPMAWEWVVVPALAECKAAVVAWWQPLGHAASSLFGAGATFWEAHLENILLGLALLMAAIYFTFVAAGTAVYRLAWRRTL